MGIHLHFAAEHRDGVGWRPFVEALEPEPPAIPRPVHRATFTWLHRRSPAVPLFGESFFDLHAGRPPDADRSPFFAHYPDDGDLAELGVRWIDVPDLHLLDWPELSFLVQGRVPARWASRFGEGRGPLRRAALTDAGMEPAAIDDLEWGSVPCDEAIDPRLGAAAHRWRTAEPGHPVPVTWMASLRSLVGARCFEAFMRLSRLAAPEQLRVILYRA